MKNLLLFIAIFSNFLSFSQIEKLPIGEYRTIKTEKEQVNLILQDKNRFSVATIFGGYVQKNDSIYFKTYEDEAPVFKIDFVDSKAASDKIILNFDALFMNYADDKYIGIQETEKSEVVYKKIQDFANYVALDYNENNKYEKTIDRCYAIYLVKENEYTKSIIEKFILPKKISRININFSRTFYKTNRLQGFYDQNTKILSVGANGQNILKFSLANNELAKSDFIIPSEKKEVENWTYAGKNDFQYNSDVKVQAPDYSADSVASVVPNYSFKLKIENSLKEAFKANRNNKLKSKFLIVVNDANDIKVKQIFSEILKSYQSEVGYSVYEKYNPENDNFDFYLTNEKDKSDLKKYGILESPSISYFNSQGERLYFSKDKITDSSFNYYNLITANIELKVLDDKYKIDSSLTDKKVTNKQTIDVLYEITKQEVPYSDNVIDANFLPPVPILDKTIVVDPDYTPPIVEKEEIKEIEAVKENEYIAPLANDSTAIAVESEFDYSQLKIKENKYKLKITESQLIDKYLKILLASQQDKFPNKKLVYINLKELNNKGFSRILYNKNATINSKMHQLQMDYVLKHYDSILKFNDIKENQINEFESEYYSTWDLESQVMQLLNASVAKENYKSNDDLKNAMVRYKKFVELTKNDDLVTTNYMNALKDNNYQKEYLTMFEDRFKSVIKDNSSIIEQLDRQFSIKTGETFNENWVGFKYDFANQANDASWYIVEKVKDINLIKKAIVWSETSVTIEKENSYFFDTLAQLYYKNGEKEKAIATEQKAIDFAIKDNDETQIDEYKLVLEKMKNGNY